LGGNSLASHLIPLFPSLTSFELKDCIKLTDRGVAAICKGIGNQLIQLTLSECHQITDYSAIIIGSLCGKLRELDLNYCGHITDKAVHSIARKLSCITCLKLDGNNEVSTRALLSHLGDSSIKDQQDRLDFVEMANQWLGYAPKGGFHTVEALIVQKQVQRKEIIGAIKIQSGKNLH
jgi:hypothetical protein